MFEDDMTESSRKDIRILLVEDNPDAAESMRMVLELVGYEVAVAEEARPALDKCKTWLPRIVFSDIGLPGGMDGYDLARAIRKEPDLKKIPLVAMSGYGQANDKKKAQEAGFDSHLTKPFDIEDMERILESMLSPKS